MKSEHLFGTSGIRGVVGQDLSPDFCRHIAQAIGTTLPPHSRACIATDTRISREVVKEAVISGLLSSGIDVTEFGILPTPALALLTRKLGFDAGVMITASHNPPEFNGLKLFNGDSLGYSRTQEAEIEAIYASQEFRSGWRGTLAQWSGVKEQYFEFIQRSLAAKPLDSDLKIVVDPGNGAASGFASDILARMGLNVLPINDEPDGLFPGRSPEPRDDTLQGTVEFLKQQNADLAICFDGDADRVVFCDKEGFLGFNEPVAFISRLFARQTGRKKVATTVETGRLLDLALDDLGVEVVRGRVGDVNVAYLAQKLDAALGVEGVGVYIIPELGYYPDSIFAVLALLSHLEHPGQIRELCQSLPALSFEKMRISCPNELKETVMSWVKDKVHLFEPARINTIDGLRLEFADSWMLIRPSGTEPAIRVIAESTSKPQADELISKGTQLIQNFLLSSPLMGED